MQWVHENKTLPLATLRARTFYNCAERQSVLLIQRVLCSSKRRLFRRRDEFILYRLLPVITSLKNADDDIPRNDPMAFSRLPGWLGSKDINIFSTTQQSKCEIPNLSM